MSKETRIALAEFLSKVDYLTDARPTDNEYVIRRRWQDKTTKQGMRFAVSISYDGNYINSTFDNDEYADDYLAKRTRSVLRELSIIK